MGLAIEQTEFSPEDHARFRERVTAELGALRTLLSDPHFGEGPPSLGAELELHLIDARARPLACNEAVLRTLNDPQFTVEINRFNLEFNAPPLPLAGTPFSGMREQLDEALRRVSRAAAREHARIAVVGILPTLQLRDLGPDALSPRPRFWALSQALRAQRGEPFRVHIEGEDVLRARGDDVTLEGANASFQVHLRVPARAFVRHYNAAQLAAAPVLACAGNSPFFAGHRLWEETRVALFKQAVDTRTQVVPFSRAQRPPCRVSFGQSWIERAEEPFAQSVALHAPLLPVVSGPGPEVALARGAIPELTALRLHQGTVWTWNRAIFDPVDAGHLRIEHRALPAGPSTLDMVANAALTLGLTLALAERIEEVTHVLPFELASRNFHAAAKYGLDAALSWPEGERVRVLPARDLALALLPEAARGLAQAGVAPEDYEPLLDIIRARVESRRTGAQVLRKLYDHYARRMPREEALAATLEHYLDQVSAGRPVHTWRQPTTLFAPQVAAL